MVFLYIIYLLVLSRSCVYTTTTPYYIPPCTQSVLCVYHYYTILYTSCTQSVLCVYHYYTILYTSLYSVGLVCIPLLHHIIYLLVLSRSCVYTTTTPYYIPPCTQSVLCVYHYYTILYTSCTQLVLCVYHYYTYYYTNEHCVKSKHIRYLTNIIVTGSVD